MTGRRLVWLLWIMAAAAPTGGSANDAARDAYRLHALENPGVAEAGQRLFETHPALACAKCHGITGVEKSGPNLEGIGNKFTRADLITHVLEPSTAIKPGYEQTVIVTTRGRVVTGRVIRATKEMYRVIDAEGRSTDVMRVDIEQVQTPAASLMPDNLVASVSKEDLADLIAYLQTLRSTVETGLEGPGHPVEISPLATPIRLVPIHPPGMKFANPVWCGAIPGLPNQLAIVEQQESRIWRLDRSGPTPRKELFADLSGQVRYGNNWGLVCLAFHPQFAKNRRYFLKHEVEREGRVMTTVVERTATADLRQDAGAASRRLLELEQPAFNHNGGCIGFGPDSMLYVAFGDGGPQRDPNGYSQDPRIFHGSLLRIDVNQTQGERPYRIPRDNPFLEAHQGDPAVRPETWAIGFREPWRFSFDVATGDLWVGDVGQDKFEEVCLVRRGENHGWNVWEAYAPFSDEYRRAAESYVPPVFAYPHSVGVSVTGGFVYRGSRAAAFDGVYIFGDYETRRIWGLRRQQGRPLAVRQLGQSPEHIASFGTDLEGELFIVGYEGTIFHLDLMGADF